MNITPVKIPLIIKKLFPNFIWKVSTNAKEIYLTFDDGPTPEITNWILNILNQYNAKATFFCIGNNIEKHPELFQNIINKGHSIGNHTHDHIKGWKTSLTDYVENIEKAQRVIDTQILNLKFQESKIHSQESIINNQHSEISNLFRPPYGQMTLKQGSELLKLGYKIVMWNVLSIDWDASVAKETCLNNVISKTDPGSVIVFHDSVKASKNMQYALPKVLAHFSEKGYVFKAI